MTINTASNLEVLLHCYITSGIHPRYTAPDVQSGLRHLLAEGMIAENEDQERTYYVTEKGKFYIYHLFTIPFPVNTWSIPS